MHRLRTNKDLECILDEVSGTAGRKELLEIQNLATRGPYIVLYINLVSPKHNEMFYINFIQQLQISD